MHPVEERLQGLQLARSLVNIAPACSPAVSPQAMLCKTTLYGATEKTFAVADAGKLKQYAFRVIGNGIVELPAGRFETIRLSRLGVGAEQLTYIRCAPELHYLPVCILQGQGKPDRVLA